MKTRLTLVGEHALPDHLLVDTRAALEHVGWLGLEETRREDRGMAVFEIRGFRPPVTFAHAGHDHEQLLKDLLGSWHALGVAAGIAYGALAVAPPRLVVMDVDSTLIPVEVIEQIAAHAGVMAEVAEITTAAMRGELDFKASLARRVAMLQGVPASVLQNLGASIDFSPGALELVAAVHASGGMVGVVSGGFHEVVDTLVARAGIDLAIANRLAAVAPPGGSTPLLTGATVGEVVDGQVKERTLREWAAQYGTPAVAIGDGANDLAMLAAADLGIAYCAKPVLAAAADAAIPFRRLDAALPLMGL